MRIEDRHRQIVEQVRGAGRVLVTELAEHFDVTPETIRRDLTVITNSVLTAACLAGAGRTRVRILGGQLRGLTQAAVGPEAVEALSTLRVDVAVLGANGLSAAHGLSTPDPDEATVKRAMVRSARQVVALVDSTKIGQEHLVSFASLDDIDLLVTDVELPPTLIDQLTATETEVLVA